MEIEHLKPEEMDTHVKNGTFRLSFVGMSNAGKSYRSRVLKNELDFYWYEVDDAIQKQLGFKDMEDIARWLGLPTDDTYNERERQYLDAEETCTHLEKLDTKGKNLVFDVTGSVIYLSDETKSWLHESCLVVNIDVDESYMEKLLAKYTEEPKPVVWGGLYIPKKDESEADTLRRCYKELIDFRSKWYREFAHLNIPLSELFDTSGEKTLSIIRNHLAQIENGA